jgi:hypothetical protein
MEMDIGLVIDLIGALMAVVGVGLIVVTSKYPRITYKQLSYYCGLVGAIYLTGCIFGKTIFQNLGDLIASILWFFNSYQLFKFRQQ